MSHLAVMAELNKHPLGSVNGENFTVPANYRIPQARIYVVNHSRTRKWKRLVLAVSHLRGAEDALMMNKGLRDVYGSTELVYKQVEKGRSMNQYKEEVKPVVFKLDLPGGKALHVPPAAKEDDPPLMVEVPDGTWDLYLGNYDRMQGYPGKESRTLPDGSPNPRERQDTRIAQEESTALALRWQTRHNPVFRVTDDGVSEDRENPFGILEFIRVPQRAVAQAIDKDYLTALDLFEAK